MKPARARTAASARPAAAGWAPVTAGSSSTPAHARRRVQRRFLAEQAFHLGLCSETRLHAQGFTGQDCAEVDPCPDLQARTQAVNVECCDEPEEDCSSGRPTTCNIGCARVLLPFFDECGEALGPGAAQFDDVYDATG